MLNDLQFSTYTFFGKISTFTYGGMYANWLLKITISYISLFIIKGQQSLSSSS